MIRFVFMIIGCLALSGCAVSQKAELSKFTTDMNIVRTYRVDLFERYMKGEVVIDDVYLDKTADVPVYGVDYHVVKFEPASGVK